MTRMIDADALTDRIEADKKQDNISPGNFFLFKAYIMNAPTIEPSGDLISRQSALAEFRDGRDVYDIMESIEELPSAEAEQVTGKLNKRDDSLLKSDSDECKEQKSKLDLISRQAAVEAIMCEPPDAHYPSWYASRIKSLPSAPDSRQRGEWVWDEDAVDWGIGAWCCSECGSVPQTWWSVERNKNPLICAGSRFCGNCGADMRGEEE